MDLWDVATVMWRRRGVTVPLLLLSVIAAVFALLTIPPAYSAKAQIAFLAPPVAPPGQVANPFTVASLAEFLSITLNRQEIRQQVDQDDPSADYRVTFKSEGLPLLGLEVVAREREAVVKIVDRLIGLVQTEAAKLQTNVLPAQAIAVSVADRGADIRVVRSAGRRALVVIAGVGLFATAGVALSVDALIRRRSRGSVPPQRRLVPRQAVATHEPSRRIGAAPLAEAGVVGAAAAPAGSRLADSIAGHESAGHESAGRYAAGHESAGREAAGRYAAGHESAGREAAGHEDEELETAGREAVSPGAAGLGGAGLAAKWRAAAGLPAASDASAAGEKQTPPVAYPADLANAVTVLLDQASSDSSGDNDVTVVLPLAGVSRPNGKQAKGPLGKRMSGDAPGGAKKR